ncbi:MAG TPA: BamA/TamA family outer membrane protein [Steroidobacteraceae bacterium]|nr:BamA/TamA family outer membrane protein [Steroidobacteraceae bacterium]
MRAHPPNGARPLRAWLALLAAQWCLLWGRPAAAAVDIDVRGVNDQLRSNVLAYLSLARYKDRELDPTMVQRLRDRAAREVAQALRPFGYYSPTVDTDLEQRGSNWRVTVRIDPGKPVMMDHVDIRVTGPGADDPHFRRILDALPLHPGDRLSHADYDRVKNDLTRVASTYGYFDARLLKSELRVDPTALKADAILQLDTGERYRFGATTIDQQVVNESLVRRFLRYREGEPFDLNLLQRTQFALDDSKYFASVEVLQGDLDRVRHIVPVGIRASAGHRDRYQFAAGYGTDTGPRGTIIWDRRLVNGSGDHFSTQLQASEIIQQLQSQYIVPIGDPALDRFAFGASVTQTIPGDLTNEDFGIGPSLTLVQDRWQYVAALTPTYSITRDGFTTQHYELLVPSMTITSVPRGYLGEALFERGLVIELRGAARPLGDQSFLQLHIQDERVFSLGGPWHLLLRGEVGATLVSKLTDLPGSMRFFAGGDQSVRGFEYDELSPVTTYENPNGTYSYVKVGGKNVITGSTEVIRDLPHDLGLAVFYDFGNAFDSFGNSGNPAYPRFLEYSVGIGLRYRLPVATFGIDVAEPISRPGAGPRVNIDFSPKL